MGKSKRRSLNQGINNKFQYMTRESALESVIKNMDKKNEIIDTMRLKNLILSDLDEENERKKIAEMNDEEFAKEFKNIAVYARVSPENKIRIVKAWQRKNQVVSMTGDGVNDALRRVNLYAVFID